MMHAMSEPRSRRSARRRTAPDRPLSAVESFDDFYRNSRSSIAHALSLTLGDPDFASEATDEAMARAFARWSTVATHPNREGWVYRTALNWARSGFRRRRRDITYAPLIARSESREAPTTDPELRRALGELSVPHRSVVVLRYLLDWDIATTAEALDIAPGTVKSRLHRALNQLATALGEPPQ